MKLAMVTELLCQSVLTLLDSVFVEIILFHLIFFRFDEDIHHVELDYPRDMSIWRGIGYHIDAAFQYKDGKSRIFRYFIIQIHFLREIIVNCKSL